MTGIHAGAASGFAGRGERRDRKLLTGRAARVLLVVSAAMAAVTAGPSSASEPRDGHVVSQARLPVVADCFYNAWDPTSGREGVEPAARVRPKQFGNDCTLGKKARFASLTLSWRRYGPRKAVARADARWFLPEEFDKVEPHRVRGVRVVASKPVVLRKVGEGLALEPGPMFTRLRISGAGLPKDLTGGFRLSAHLGEGGACRLGYFKASGQWGQPCVTGLPKTATRSGPYS